MKKVPAAVAYDEGHYEDLRDPVEAALYFNAALKAGDPDGILVAMHHIAKARNVTQIADAINVHRVSLHRMLRKNGNPTLRTFLELLRQFGIVLEAAPRDKAA